MAPSVSQEPTYFVPRPTLPPEEEDNKITIIIVMVSAVLCVLCCGYNRGYAEINKYSDPQRVMKDFWSLIFQLVGSARLSPLPYGHVAAIVSFHKNNLPRPCFIPPVSNVDGNHS
jgi:hypothetical protein